MKNFWRISRSVSTSNESGGWGPGWNLEVKAGHITNSPGEQATDDVLLEEQSKDNGGITARTRQ